MIEYTKKMQISEKKSTSLEKEKCIAIELYEWELCPMHQTYFNKSLTSDKFPSLAAGLIERR